MIDVRAATWADDQALIAAVRRTVFIDEQRVPEALEWDGLDDDARHWLARAGERAVGTARLLPGGQIGRMAVLAPWRRRGVGSALLHAALGAARAAGLGAVFLHAQVHALAFYARHGFVVEGPVFDDAGIPHRAMRLAFKQSA